MSAGAVAEISVVGLAKRFDAQPALLDEVDLTAPGGTVTLIVGAAGSGKSTLARCLTGVYRPTDGSVTYRLRDSRVELTTADARTVAWLRTHHITAFDGPFAAPPRLPAATATARAARCSDQQAVAALHRLHVAGLASLPVGRLRAADRHTVALAAALLAERPFVVLDEPERFAEPQTLTRWLRRLTDGGATVVVTGSPDTHLRSLAWATGELQRGKITWHKR